MVILYLTCEALLLVVLFGLWFASGFGWRVRTPYFEGIHYDLVQGVMWVFFREARRVLRAEDRDRRADPGRPPRRADPGRAAGTPGPGDSFTLIHALMHWYHREPRVVLKDTLAWDPVIDVVLNRIPARFIDPTRRRRGSSARSPTLAHGLDENDAFVIFPEGGNFTPARRQRGIDRLRKLGHGADGRRAEAMTHVLAPRPGGFIAALDGAPDADVVLVAHTGLDHMLTVGDVWRELPMDKQIMMRWWQVPREEIPDRPRRADRVALRLVGADRRLDRSEPPRGSLRRPVPRVGGDDGCGQLLVSSPARRGRPCSAGSSGVVTGWALSAASASASSGEEPAAVVGRARPTGPADAEPAAGSGCRRTASSGSSWPPLSFLATNAAAAATPPKQQTFLNLPPFFFGRLALELGHLGGRQVAALGRLRPRRRRRPDGGLLCGDRGAVGDQRLGAVTRIGDDGPGLVPGVRRSGTAWSRAVSTACST